MAGICGIYGQVLSCSVVECRAGSRGGARGVVDEIAVCNLTVSIGERRACVSNE